jgi:hypothetical protein
MHNTALLAVQSQTAHFLRLRRLKDTKSDMNFDFKYSLHCRLYNSYFKQLFTSIFHGKYFQAIFDRERRAEELVGEVLLVFNDIMIVRIIAGSLFFK